MARQTRRFPAQILLGQRQALAVPVAAPTTRLITPIVITARPAAPRLVATARDSHVYLVAGSASARAVPVLPAHPVTQNLVAETGPLLRRRRGVIVQNRWPGYQWVGLPPVTPLIQPHVQALVESTEQRRHVQSRVVQPGVQLIAATAGTAPVTPRLIQPIVIQLVAETTPRRRTHGNVTTNRWPGYEWVGLPPVLPLRPVTVVLAVAPARPRRHGAVIAPQTRQGVITRPVSTVVTARPVTVPQRRRGCVVQPRRIAAPVTPPRPVIIDLLPVRRQRRSLVIATHGFAAAAPATTTTTQLSLSGYVTSGDQGTAVAGDSGIVTGGDSGSVSAGASGQVNI